MELLESRLVLATFMVANLSDGPVGGPGDLPGCLRQAIHDANASPGADIIDFTDGLSGSILLAEGELAITESVTIDATSLSNGLTIDAQRLSRIFNITATTGDFTLAGLTLRGGQTTANSDHGGAIRSVTSGMLTIGQSTITGNRTTGWNADGGGVYSVGDLALTDSMVSGNSTAGDYAQGGGVLFVRDVTLTGSTVSGNSTAGLRANGGGVYSRTDSVQLTDSTVSGNSTTGSDANGGGIRAYSGTRLNNTIVAGNTVVASSNPDLLEGNGTPTVNDSLIGDNTGTNLAEAPVGMPDSNGNLIGGPINGVIDPLLGPLADNGGPTWTCALDPGSPAVDAGDPTAVSGVHDVPLHDQRGAPYTRVHDGRIDIGAFELQPPPVDGDFNDDGVYDCLDIDALIVKIADATDDPAYDLTGDGLVGLDDRDAWLAEAGEINLGVGKAYLLGDATLDGAVDVSDFNIWNANKFAVLTVIPGWCLGNFNADTVVDVSDFNIWNANKFLSSDAIAPLFVRLAESVPQRMDRSGDSVTVFEPTHQQITDETLRVRRTLSDAQEVRSHRAAPDDTPTGVRVVRMVEEAFAEWG